MLHLEFWIRFTQFYTFTVFACGAFNSRAIKSFYFLVLVLLRMTNVPLPSAHDRARVGINLHGVSRDAGVSRPREQHQSRD